MHKEETGAVISLPVWEDETIVWSRSIPGHQLLCGSAVRADLSWSSAQPADGCACGSALQLITDHRKCDTTQDEGWHFNLSLVMVRQTAPRLHQPPGRIYSLNRWPFITLEKSSRWPWWQCAGYFSPCSGLVEQTPHWSFIKAAVLGADAPVWQRRVSLQQFGGLLSANCDADVQRALIQWCSRKFQWDIWSQEGNSGSCRYKFHL